MTRAHSKNVSRVAAVCAVNLAIVLIVAATTGASFTYPLDDAYIHLSIARTIAETGIWGVDKFDPASASSSPLYSLLLASLYSIFGGSTSFEYVPLVVNIVALIACVSVWAAILSDESHLIAGSAFNDKKLLGRLLVLSVGTPLFGIALIGMEHTLQTAIATLFIYFGTKKATDAGHQEKAVIIVLFLLSMTAMAIRYESVLFIATLCLFFLTRKKYGYATALILGSLCPILILGELWTRAGGWMIPNTILMKHIEFAQGGVNVRLAKPTLLLVAALEGFLLLAVLVRQREKQQLIDLLTSNWRMAFAISSFLVAAAQLMLGIVGWLYRYEAMIISLNIVSILLLADSFSGRKGYLIVICLLMILAGRFAHMSKLLTAAPQDRQWEHVKPATMIAQFYKNQAVVVNDVGLVAWLAPDARIMDMTGLANNEMAALRMQADGLTPAKTQQWAENGGAKIAVLQICWDQIYPYIPENWQLVSVWRGPRNVIFHDVYIGFFGTNDENAAELRRNLMQSPIPDGVKALYFDGSASADNERPLDVVKQNGCPDVELDKLLGSFKKQPILAN